MKNLLRLSLLACLVLAASTASAQKFGIINSQELIALMPELDTVQTKMKAFTDELQAQMETIQVEFNQKYEDYNANLATLSDAVKQLKEKELQDLQNRFESFRQVAQQDIQRKQQELMTPVITRAENAIKKVGKDGGYWLIFDEASGPTVYNNETHVTSVLSTVKKELGIPENAKPRGAAAQLAQ
ncbi:MAG: OmpH family outer membrane protein [Rikenellaceae bacterium]|jgi:outer membrane protein|nr:OmpH family outer membrane protein [Rikenellaceae bacterium]